MFIQKKANKAVILIIAMMVSLFALVPSPGLRTEDSAFIEWEKALPSER